MWCFELTLGLSSAIFNVSLSGLNTISFGRQDVKEKVTRADSAGTSGNSWPGSRFINQLNVCLTAEY